MSSDGGDGAGLLPVDDAGKTLIDQVKAIPVEPPKRPKQNITPKEYLLSRLASARPAWTKDMAGDDFDLAVSSMLTANEKKIGLIISGDYGCGKTSFVIASGLVSRKIDCTIPEKVDCLKFSDYPDYVNDLMERNVLLDDIGAECLQNDYGIKRDLVGDFICRYHLYGKGRLFITTNLRGEELLDRYGGRVLSRLKDLCYPVRFTGKDKRKWEL